MELDQRAKDLLALVYPDVRSRVIRVYAAMAEAHGLQMRPCQGLRTIAEQDALYAKGRTTNGPKVTNAKGGSSMHNYGLAVDSCFVGEDPWLERNKQNEFLWAEYGKFCVANGLVWGGNFTSIKDRPHCELAYGLSLRDLRSLHCAGKLAGCWAKIDGIRKIPVASEYAALHDKLLTV